MNIENKEGHELCSYDMICMYPEFSDVPIEFANGNDKGTRITKPIRSQKQLKSFTQKGIFVLTLAFWGKKIIFLNASK